MKYILFGLLFLTTPVFAQDCSSIQTQVDNLKSAQVSEKNSYEIHVTNIKQGYASLTDEQDKAILALIEKYDGENGLIPQQKATNATNLAFLLNQQGWSKSQFAKGPPTGSNATPKMLAEYKNYVDTIDKTTNQGLNDKYPPNLYTQKDDEIQALKETFITTDLDTASKSYNIIFNQQFSQMISLQSQLADCNAQNSQVAGVNPTPIVKMPTTVQINVIPKASNTKPIVNVQKSVVTEIYVPSKNMDAIIPSVIKQQTVVPVKVSIIKRFTFWFKSLF